VTSYDRYYQLVIIAMGKDVTSPTPVAILRATTALGNSVMSPRSHVPTGHKMSIATVGTLPHTPP
jgi:hypothetical protein